MAKIHDLFIVELAEVIKGYGNDPDVADPFRLSEFYRFYELPNIAVSRENFEKMRPVEPERKKGKWIRWYETKEDETGTEYIPHCRCSECGTEYDPYSSKFVSFCNVCGAKMEEGEQA